MGLFKNYVSQTRKPEGFLGKMMIKGMNSGHAKMTDWGMSHLKPHDPSAPYDGYDEGDDTEGKARNERLPKAMEIKV